MPAPSASLSSAALNVWLAVLLRPFARVKPSEVVGAAVMTLAVFLLLTGYYLLKTAREPLILLHGGAEVKQYAAAGQATLLVGVVRGYAWLAKRVGRTKLIAIVYLFFVSNLVVFAVLARTHWTIGVPFYLWVGAFNMTAVSQFWSLAADIYDEEQGRRLFAIIGVGGSMGAVLGARLAKSLAHRGPATLMDAAAVLLLACTALLIWIARCPQCPRRTTGEPGRDAPLAHDNLLRWLMRDRYLLLIAALALVLNWVRSNGDYVLDRTLLAAVTEAKAKGLSADVFVTTFKANYFQWVNITTLVLQLFVVSRVMSRLGVTAALLCLPVFAFAEYAVYLALPVLSVFLVAKVGESSLEYSMQNTSRQALFLEASRMEKYVGKTVVDTFVVRAGDALTAVVVLAGSRVGLSPQAFASLNLLLIVLWVFAVLAIGRESLRRAGMIGSAGSAEPALPDGAHAA
ncbi:MAG: translocase [Polyangiaceae bacterium]|jgi:AAA family ATP:ADP antiporter